MAYSEDARRRAGDELARRRLQTAMADDARRAKVFSEHPEIAAVDAEIRRVGIEGLRRAVADKNKASAEDCKTRIEALRRQQAALLERAGLDRDILAPTHRCAACADTGILPDGRTCDCASALMRGYTMEEIGKSSPLALCHFSTFSLDYYSPAVDPEYGKSPRENMQYILNACRRYAAEFPASGRNLLMVGGCGLGKTHLALSIASDVLEKGYNVLYCSAAGIFKQIEFENFNLSHDGTTLSGLKNCDLLVLDDIGAEFVTSFVASAFYDLLNTRIIERRSTILTTNYQEDVLTRRYSEKICSRLFGCSTILPFFGEDIRIQRSNSRAPKAGAGV